MELKRSYEEEKKRKQELLEFHRKNWAEVMLSSRIKQEGENEDKDNQKRG